jgi:hypothetical protein
VRRSRQGLSYPPVPCTHTKRQPQQASTEAGVAGGGNGNGRRGGLFNLPCRLAPLPPLHSHALSRTRAHRKRTKVCLHARNPRHSHSLSLLHTHVRTFDFCRRADVACCALWQPEDKTRHRVSVCLCVSMRSAAREAALDRTNKLLKNGGGRPVRGDGGSAGWPAPCSLPLAPVRMRV